jgi:hypothetical protein
VRAYACIMQRPPPTRANGLDRLILSLFIAAALRLTLN